MIGQEASSRRAFLRMGVTAAASACGGCALFGSCKPDVVAESEQGQVRLSQAESSVLLEPEGSLLVQTKATRDKILVVNHGGRLYAVSAICTHMGCAVGYSKEMGHIVCPCHGSQYALDGSNLKGPAKRPLKRYGVAAENGQVVITL